MRAVLDTNVLISSVISTGVPHEIVVKGFSSEYQQAVARSPRRERTVRPP